MNDLISSVSSRIERAINETINEQILPRIQATPRSGQDQVPSGGWEVPGRRPQCRSEEALNCKFRSNSRDELARNCNIKEDLENTQYKRTIHGELEKEN